MEGDREIQQGYLPGFLGPAATKLRREGSEKPELVMQWLSDRGDTTIRQIAGTWGVAAAAVEPVLESLFALLVERGLLVSVRLKGGPRAPIAQRARRVSGQRRSVASDSEPGRAALPELPPHHHAQPASSALRGLALRRHAGVGEGGR